MSEQPSPDSTASQLNVPIEGMRSPQRPRPLASLVASAQRLTDRHVKTRTGFGRPQAWQEDAWEMFDLVGEQRFLTTTLANRLSQARLFVGRVPDNPVEEPEPLESDESLPARVFAKFGNTPAQRSQMIARLASNLFIAGDGWFVGIPRHLMPGAPPRLDRPSLDELTLDDLEWRMMSISEVSFAQGMVTLALGEDASEHIMTKPDAIFLIRVWRPHPRRFWQADSPTRSSLPILRELVGLTMHISAQVDSRLAGAGLLIVPQSAKRALQVAAGIPEDSDEDPFTEALIEAMLTPIQDRASASAVVPLVVTVPDEACDKFKLITFDKPLDTEARPLREEAIRRLALGQDAPPELLLGTAGMNHWGAWLVREDVVTTHIEPPLALVCDAITTQYLWPVLIEAGMDEEEARNYVVWYDVSHMVQRPNRLADAMSLHGVGAVNDETLREAGGFTDEDAPSVFSRAVEIAVQIVTANPATADNLDQIISGLVRALTATPLQVAAIEGTPELKPGEDPTTDGNAAKGGAAPGPSTGGAAGTPARTPGGKVPARRGGTSVGTSDAAAGSASDPGAPPGGAVAASMAADTSAPIKATKAGWAPRPPVDDTPEGHGARARQRRALLAAGGENDDSVCIVAKPANADTLPGPEEKHATLIYLGHLLSSDVDDEQLATYRTQIESAIGYLAPNADPITATVTGVGQLGDEGAHVMFLDPASLGLIRDALMGDPLIGALHEEGDFTKHPTFRAHVTLGYGDEVDDTDRYAADLLTSLDFDTIELWWGNERTSFPMGSPQEAENRLAEVARAAETAGDIAGLQEHDTEGDSDD